jgi:Histidine kinase/Two component regulator propeller
MKYFLFTLFTILSWLSNAQNLSYRTIDKARGLPTNTIYDLLQDHQGFIWLGTDKGLFRYDGITFKPFLGTGQNDKSISNLMEDVSGRIWGQNFSGQYFHNQGDSLILSSEITPIGAFYPAALVGKKNMFCLDNSNIIRIVDLQNHKIKNIKYSPAFGGAINFTPYSFAHKDFVYFLNNYSKQIVGVNTFGKMVFINTPKDFNTFYTGIIKERFFFIPKVDATEIRLRNQDGTYSTIQLGRKNFIQNVKVIDDRFLGLFTSSGLYLIDILLNEKTVNPIFTDKNVSSFIKDQEGDFWISTINNGLMFVPSLSMKIIEPQKGFARLQSIDNQNTMLYGTTDNQVAKLDFTQQKTTTIYKGITNAEILSLYHDVPSNSYLFSSDKFYGIQNNRPRFAIAISVKDIEPLDNQKIVYAATGLAGVVDLVKQDTILKLKNSSGRCRAVTIDKLNKITYLATSKGFWMYKSSGESIEIKDKNNSFSFIDLGIIEQVNAAPLIVAASTGEGIFIFQNNKIILHLTEKDGLESNGVYRIKIHKNQIWWLTEKALQSYDLTTKIIKTFTKTDGLPDTDLKDIAFLKDKVYVATLAGLVYFPENLSDKDPHIPSIISTAFFCNKREEKLNDNLIFSYDHNNIDLYFSVISYRSLESLKVFYKINNQEWVALENNTRVLSLPFLSPDNYVVRLKSVNADGQESKEKVVKFTIKKPFWTSYWFIGLGLLIFGFGVHILYRRRIARLAKETQLYAEKLVLEQDLQKSLLTSIKSQMNPHFIFNALNTIQSYIYLNDKQNASSYLVKFSELTRMILDMSNSEFITLKDEIKTVKLYLELEKMRFEDTLVYTLSIDPILSLEHTLLPSMLIQPYIENALKHGLMHKKNDRILLIDFSLNEDCLQVIIDDNGVGRKKSNEINQQRANRYQSFATKANQKRLELLNVGHKQQIGIDIIDKIDADNQAIGTKVVLKIPIKVVEKEDF